MEHSTITLGIDEAGRGALCGPVSAACVSFYRSKFSSFSILQDSKLLRPEEREQIAFLIKRDAFYGFGWAQVHEIDSINIHHASLLAMQRAFDCCLKQIQAMEPSILVSKDNLEILVDGKFCPKIAGNTRAIIKGDTKIAEIMAASILAKTGRDSLVQLQHEVYPEYGIAGHKGYATKQHRKALNHLGPSALHRKSFRMKYVE